MKKMLITAFLMILFSLPSLILYFSMQNFAIQLQNEYQKQKFRMLHDKLQNTDQLSNPIEELHRNLFLLLRNLSIPEFKMDPGGNVNDNLLAYLKAEILSFHSSKDLKTTSSLVYRKNGIDNYFSLSNNEESGHWLENLTAHLRHFQQTYNITQAFPDIKTLQNLLTDGVGGFINLNILIAEGSAQRLQRSVIRTDAKVILLMFLRFTNSLLLNFSFDLTDYSMVKQFEKRIKEHEDSSIGIMIKLKTGDKKYLFSDFFENNPVFATRVARLMQNGTPNSFNSIINNYLITASAEDPKKAFRVLLACKAPEVEKNLPMQLIIALFAIAGCLCFKLSCDHILMGRKIQLSITFFIVAVFISVSMLPMLSSVYLAGEYIVANFKIARTEVFETLENELKAMDHQTYANLKNTVNSLKSLDSLESIASLTNLKIDASPEDMFHEMLNRLRTEKVNCSELWVYEDKQNVFGYKFHHENRTYVKDRGNNQFLLEVFLPKFKQFMNSGREPSHTPMSGEKKEIEIESLRAEMLDNFILNLFGDKTYYSARESFDHLLKFESMLETNAVLNLPVSHRNKRRFVLTFVFSSKDIRDMFPVERLAINIPEPTFCISGNDQFMGGVPGNVNRMSRLHPDLMKVARQAHLTGTRLVTQDTSIPETPVYEALPARYSDFVISGKRLPPTLSSITSGLVKNALKISIFAASSGLILALLTALYFTLPIRRLTDATQEIINENYSIRLETSHPDEFATAATAFNKMAAGLEEGRLLSKFVSKSVQEIAAQGSAGINAARSAEVTVLFSTIKDFHLIRRNLEPEKAFEILQAHLSAAVESIRAHGGEIDKMIEDKVMIVFSRETGSNNPQTAAVQTAFNIRRLLKDNLNLSTAAGINSGEVISGVMGAASVRLSNTVIGDTVNLAARLAYVAGELANGGVVAEKQTTAFLSADFKAQKLEISKVKGKTHAVEAYLVSNE